MIGKSILIWLTFIPLAILNGGLRENILDPMLGKKIANPISCFILCCMVFLVTYIFLHRLGNGTVKQYIMIGLLWILLTIVFETALSLFMGLKFKEIINSYNIATGNFWLLVVIFIGFTPLLVSKIRRICL